MSVVHVVKKAVVWIYPGLGGWHFVYVPKEISQLVRKESPPTKGFGFVPIVATVGSTTWKTVLIWSSKEQVYLIALKALVRKKEGIVEGDKITLAFQIDG
ncbi:MAG: DUF1905 domain-containing protein [Minisyncoccia bacterium]